MLNFGLIGVVEDTPPFDGGMFVNGGFENGIAGWLQSSDWTATVGADSAENPSTGTNQVLFQNFTFEAGVSYEISANQLAGDVVANFMVNDVDSGADITAGVHTFVGDGTPRSTGIFLVGTGTTTFIVDSLRLVRVP